MTQETVRYSYRLRVSKTTETWLLAEWGKARWVWNECVDLSGRNAKLSKDERVSMGSAALCKLLSQARGEMSWLREGSAVAQQQMIRNFSQAHSRSFKVKGSGRPKHKARKKSLPSLNFVGTSFSVSEADSGNYILRMPHKHTAVVVTSRELPSEPRSVQVSQRSDGHWYASFVVTRERTELSPTDFAFGVDWGVKDTAVTTDNDCDIPYQGFSKKEMSEMARLDKMLSRRRPARGQKASRGYRNVQKQRAKLHQKIVNRRSDHAVKWANKVVRKHDVIGVEDFKSGFVNRNRSFSRKTHDASVGALKAKLVEVASAKGRKVVMVPPAYTTMTCNSCTAIAKQRLELDVRTFVCEFCGHSDDRDKNAAKNIRDIALNSP